MTNLSERNAHPDTDPGTVPHVLLDTEECSYIHAQMSEAIQRYIASIHNDKRHDFRTKESLTEKVNKICWEWGLNPETYPDSVNLRSLHVIRTLEDTIVRPEENDGRRYLMYLGDPYWQAVDRKVYDHFSSYVAAETAQTIMPYESLTRETPSAICVMQDHLIARLHDKGDNVHYAAIPLHKIGEIAGGF